MSSKYDLDSLKKLNKQELKEDSDGLETLLMMILEQQEQTPSKKTLEVYMKEYLHWIMVLRKDIQDVKDYLPNVTEELTKQAGKMSEQYSLLTKKTESYRTRIKDRQLKFIVISQSVLLVLSQYFSCY